MAFKVDYNKITAISDRMVIYKGKLYFTVEDLKLFPDKVTLIDKNELLKHYEPETLDETVG